MAEKSPYKLTVKLSSARPDAIGEALTALRELMAEHDQSGETVTTLAIESYKEAPLIAICNLFELWLYRYKIGIECEIGLKRPGVRPETIVELRARNQTPMDHAGWETDESVQPEGTSVLITPIPLELPAPGQTAVEAGVEEALFTVDTE